MSDVLSNCPSFSSDEIFYKEAARSYEYIQRADVARRYRAAAFLYVREALDEYLEHQEMERVRGTIVSPIRFALEPIIDLVHSSA